MDPVTRLREQAEHFLLLGRTVEAVDRCAEALAMEPQNASVHLTMGRAHLAAGEHALARDAAARSMGLDLTVSAMHVLSIAHRLLGDHQIALDLIDRAIAIRPEGSALHVGRSLTLVAPYLGEPVLAKDDGLGRETVMAAMASARHAAELDAEGSRAHYALGLCSMVLDDLPGAAGHLDHALEREPDWSDAHLLLGRVRARQGMTKLASRHFAAAGHLAPTTSTPLDSLRSLVGSRPGALRRMMGLPGAASRVRVVPEAARILAVDQRLRDGNQS